MSYQPVGGSGYSTPNHGGAYRDDPDAHNYDSTYRGTNDYHMSSGNPYAAHSSDPSSYPKKKSSKRKLWWILGILLLIGIIVGVVVGAVVGTRAHKNNNSATSSNDKSNSGDDNKNNGVANGSTDSNDSSNPGKGPGSSNSNDTATKTDASGRPTSLPTLLNYISQDKDYVVGSNGNTYLPLATDSYLQPAYGLGSATSGYAAPSVATDAADNSKWPSDPDSPSASSPRSHPRLIAPQYKWDALKNTLIDADPYFKKWSDSIIQNATDVLDKPGVAYVFDGGPTGSGVLDIARETKMRVKNLAFSYKITGDAKFADRLWEELQHASNQNKDFGNNNTDGDIWNCAGHFLDCAEFISAFAIGYDWLHDHWTEDQATSIRGWIRTNGLARGTKGWWQGSATETINGNWNCVSNGGLLMGALAIMNDDNDNTAAGMIDGIITNAEKNCFQGAYSDGSWAETPNYWYFGTTGAAELVSALKTAINRDIDFEQINPGWKFTSLYHMYVTGMTWLYSYGDHGPNKFSSTANSLMLWGSLFDEPRYTLYQRDRNDALEPFSMFWYDPAVRGTWWSGLAIDHQFDSKEGGWGTARSSWTDNSGTYWAMKAGLLTNHQNHQDLDIGDFVFDAMGQRWAGELGSDQYLGNGYFNGAKQDDPRWTYYRKRTEGQNAIVIGKQNQLLTAEPVVKFESSGTKQGDAPSLAIGSNDTAYMTIDMSSAYKSGVTAKRGIRFLNARTQVLLQDEVSGTGSDDIMWRMHTNATVNVDSDGTTATLTMPNTNLTMTVNLLNAKPEGLKFTTQEPATYMEGDSVTGPTQGGESWNINESIPNPNVTVLVIENSAGGDMHTEVLFTPNWSGDFKAQTPNSVALDSWGLDSH